MKKKSSDGTVDSLMESSESQIKLKLSAKRVSDEKGN